MNIGAYSMIQTTLHRQLYIKLISCVEAFALGFACRFGLHVKPDSRGIYIAEDFFVILSVSPFVWTFWFERCDTFNVQPCAFIAADYVLLGRLARYIGSGKHLLVPPNRITITFVISDITTFLIQVRYIRSHSCMQE